MKAPHLDMSYKGKPKGSENMYCLSTYTANIAQCLYYLNELTFGVSFVLKCSKFLSSSLSSASRSGVDSSNFEL